MAHDPTTTAKPRFRDWLRAARQYKVPGPWNLFVICTLRYLRPSHHPSTEASTQMAMEYLAQSPAARAAGRQPKPVSGPDLLRTTHRPTQPRKAGDRLEVVEGLTAKTRARPRSIGCRPSRYRSPRSANTWSSPPAGVVRHLSPQSCCSDGSDVYACGLAGHLPREIARGGTKRRPETNSLSMSTCSPPPPQHLSGRHTVFECEIRSAATSTVVSARRSPTWRWMSPCAHCYANCVSRQPMRRTNVDAGAVWRP